MTKIKHAKGVCIQKGEGFFFNEYKEKYFIRCYELLLEDENGQWKRYSYNNEPEEGNSYWFIYQSDESRGKVVDQYGNEIPVNNAILVWRIEENEIEGIFLQKDNKKKWLHVMSWETMYTQPAVAKRMVMSLFRMFSKEVIGTDLETVFGGKKLLEGVVVNE